MDACRCRPSYQAQAGPRQHRQTRTFSTLAAAKGWKGDTERAFRQGAMLERAPRLRDAATEWLDLAERGIVRARGNRLYRPSTLRGYRAAMEQVIMPELGDRRLDQVTRGELNRLVQRLQARGMAAQTVKNAIIPVRALYRHAIDLEQVTANPTAGVRVPAGSGRRMNVVDGGEIGRLLEALEPGDRALWATAFYSGLRRGELMALAWADVDLGAGVITVRRSWDKGARVMGDVKSAAGQDRRVAIAGVLRDHLLEHRQRAGARPGGLVFARGALSGVCRRAEADQPFSDTAVSNRARKAWNAGRLPHVTLHDCRHTFASLMIAAMATGGTFNPKTLQHMLGHASIQQTYDRYGHLFPGAESEAVRLLDAYLELSTPYGVAPGPQVAQASSREAGDLVLPSVARGDGAACERQADVPRSGIRRVR